MTEGNYHSHFEGMGKVLFSQVSVCLHFRGGGGSPQSGREGRGGLTPIWPMGEGVPPYSWWGIPHLVDGGIPPIGTVWGYLPHWDWMRKPLCQDWMGGTPHQDCMKVPPNWDWMGYHPHWDWMGDSPPLPPPETAAERALATWWAVCLLCSPRTFLCLHFVHHRAGGGGVISSRSHNTSTDPRSLPRGYPSQAKMGYCPPPPAGTRMDHWSPHVVQKDKTQNVNFHVWAFWEKIPVELTSYNLEMDNVLFMCGWRIFGITPEHE